MNSQVWDGNFSKIFGADNSLAVDLLLVPYGESPDQVANNLHLINKKIAGLTESQRGRVRVAKNNLAANGGQLSDPLMRLGRDMRKMVINSSSGSVTVFGVAASGFGSELKEPANAQLINYGNDACGGKLPAASVKGKIAVIPRGACAFVDKVDRARLNGAVGVVLANNASSLSAPVGNCAACSSIHVSMVSQTDGNTIGSLIEKNAVNVVIANQRMPATALRLPAVGGFQQVGFIPYPFNASLGKDLGIDPFSSLHKEAEYLKVQSALTRRLLLEDSKDDGVTSVAVFNGEVAKDPDWNNKKIHATITRPKNIGDFDRLEIEHKLECLSDSVELCPPWDYENNLYLCESGNLISVIGRLRATSRRTMVPADG